jgi:hypothetical protein
MDIVIHRMKLSCFTMVFFIYSSSYSQGVAVGQRFDLTAKLQLGSGQFAQVFVPDYYSHPADGKFTLVFHLHSASWAAEDQVYKSHTQAILFNIHLGGLSSPYQNYFSDQTQFQRILDTVVSVIRVNNIHAQPEIRSLIITSFSAGYAGLREMLKSPAYYARIDAITLADGLHSSSDPATMQVQMADFLRFARDSRDRTKVMLLTHSSIPTPGYQSTTQTADYLIQGIGAQRVPFSVTDSIGTQYSRCDTGYFHLKGYHGDTANDHLKHLYHMDKMLVVADSIVRQLAVDVPEQRSGPHGFRLQQNYPNPFNPATVIQFAVPAGALNCTSLHVYDQLGREVATLVDDELLPGEYSVTWNAERFAGGVYFYRLQTGAGTITNKMVLLR